MADLGKGARIHRRRRSRLETLFPGLRNVRWEVTSEQDPRYNCHAHTLNQSGLQYDPTPSFAGAPGVYWPRRLPRSLSIETFVALFGSEGFIPCDDGRHDPALEKVAIYTLNGRVEHSARQLSDGTWSSKIGLDEDIMHEVPDALEGSEYGAIELYMSRPWP